MKISDIISKHKKRIDRGGMYWGYFQGGGMIAVIGILIKVKAWWIYGLAIFLVLLIRYFLGYIDEKSNTLKREQKRYSDENEVMMELLRLLKENNVILKDLNKNS